MPILKELLYPEIHNDKVYLTNQPFDPKAPAKVITNKTKGNVKELLAIFNGENFK